MKFTDAHSGSSVCTPTRERADKKAAKVKGEGKGLMGAPLGAVTPDGPLTRGFDTFFGFHHARMMRSLFEQDRVTQLIEPVDMLPLLAAKASAHVTERAKSGLGDYGDFVMETDWAVGEVLAALDQAGIANNTLVLFTSDNGCSPQAGTTRLEAQGHFPSAQYRGYKSDIWDGGHRVAFFARWPDKVKVASQSAQLICHTDLMATCAEILGVKLPENAGEYSVSILPALLGTDRQPLREAVAHHSINGSFAIRQGSWKLELCPGSGGWGKPGDAEAMKQGMPGVQLYDLSADFAETKNVQAEHPEIVARMTKVLEQKIANGRSTPGVRQSSDARIVLFKSNPAKAPRE